MHKTYHPSQMFKGRKGLVHWEYVRQNFKFGRMYHVSGACFLHCPGSVVQQLDKVTTGHKCKSTHQIYSHTINTLLGHPFCTHPTCLNPHCDGPYVYLNSPTSFWIISPHLDWMLSESVIQPWLLSDDPKEGEGGPNSGVILSSEEEEGESEALDSSWIIPICFHHLNLNHHLLWPKEDKVCLYLVNFHIGIAVLSGQSTLYSSRTAQGFFAVFCKQTCSYFCTCDVCISEI